MFLLKLYHESDESRPMAAHLAGEGTTRVGRDPTADWVIPDPECEVSRNHFELVCRDAKLTLRPLGANGVFRAGDDEPLPTGEDLAVEPGDTFCFGKYRLLVDPTPFGSQAPAASNQTMVLAAPFGESPDIPSEWADAAELPPMTGDGSLLEAFCEGAKLDASSLLNEDPAEVMRQAGAIYRQMVLGLGDLMSERSSVKTQYRMDRTTIGARDNNPFKWAPTQRLAIDLLSSQEYGFLSGQAGVKASFEDVKRHLLSTLAGFHATLLAVLDMAGPASIEQRVEGQSLFLKSRSAACWEEYSNVHAVLDREARENVEGMINQAFIAAYEAKMRELSVSGPDR